MIPLTYHEKYNKYDLGITHPLIGDKPKKTIEYLKEKEIIKKIDIIQAKKASEKDLLLTHSQDYIQRVKKLSETGGMLSMDTPAPKGIYDVALYPVGGTIQAGEKLFNGYKIAGNPLAGFHHASRNFGSGFCFFNDISIVIEKIRTKHNLKKFIVIDLDVHHANGTQEIYYDNPSVLLISFHQDGKTLYPGTGAIDKIGKNKAEGYNINLPLKPETGNKSYLYAFKRIIPKIVKQYNPDFIIYQSGVDAHHLDPLANLNLTYQIFYQLADNLRKLSKETCDKLLVLFGGGYNSQSCVYSYYNIMNGLLNTKEFIEEKEKEDKNYEYTKKQVDILSKLVSEHWHF